MASGPTTNFHIDDVVTIGAAGGSGGMTISDQATGFFRALNMAIFPQANTQAALTIDSGAKVSVFALARINGSGNGSMAHAVIDGAGSSLTVGGNAIIAVGANVINGGAGQLDISNGGLAKLDPGFGIVSILELGTLNIANATLDSAGSDDVNNAGLVHLSNGLVMLSNGADFNNNGGTVMGTGEIHLGGGSFNNNGGVVAPGNSPGGLELVNGAFVADQDSILEIELGGTGPGQSDTLVVGGNAALARIFHKKRGQALSNPL